MALDESERNQTGVGRIVPMMPAQQVEIPRTEIHAVQSEEIGAEFEIWIADPGEPRMGSSGLPTVLYLLDANLYFGTATEMTRLMTQLFGELPPVLVVGIAYPTDDPAVSAQLRNRDFTPSADPGFAEMVAQMPDFEPVLPEGERMGHADRFLDFLVDEVRPLAEGRHATDPEHAILFGSSLSGLFALHALLRRPNAFTDYIAVSPAIWWNDAELLGLEDARGGEWDDLDARLYLAVGELEESERVPFLARYRMITNARELAGRLEARSYPSFQLRNEVIAGETHTSVVPSALIRGLRWLAAPGGQ